MHSSCYKTYLCCKSGSALATLVTRYAMPCSGSGRSGTYHGMRKERSDRLLKWHKRSKRTCLRKQRRSLAAVLQNLRRRSTAIQQRLHRWALLWRCRRAQTLSATSQQRAPLRVLACGLPRALLLRAVMQSLLQSSWIFPRLHRKA